MNFAKKVRLSCGYLNCPHALFAGHCRRAQDHKAFRDAETATCRNNQSRHDRSQLPLQKPEVPFGAKVPKFTAVKRTMRPRPKLNGRGSPVWFFAAPFFFRRKAGADDQGGVVFSRAPAIVTARPVVITKSPESCARPPRGHSTLTSCGENRHRARFRWRWP